METRCSFGCFVKGQTPENIHENISDFIILVNYAYSDYVIVFS